MKTVLMLTVPVAMVIGCSGNQSGNGKLDSGTLLVALSPDEATQLCDWMAGLYGGYGGTVTCDSGAGSSFGKGVSGPADRMSCTAQFSGFKTKFASCQETVGKLQTCLQQQVQNFCAATPVTPPAMCMTASAQCG